jgi:hypothetical protein
MCFTRLGYLCRHIFSVFRVQKVKAIPDQYVVRRWLKQALPSRVYSVSNRLRADTSEVTSLKNEVMDCVTLCVDQLSSRVDGLSCFVAKLKEMKKSIVDEQSASSSSKTRAGMIQKLVGDVPQTGIELRPPQGIRNKGCGTNRRLVGPGEKSVEKSQKNPRICHSCNELTFHDARNCKKKGQAGPSNQ